MEWISVKERMPDGRSIKEVLTIEYILYKNGKIKPIVCLEETKSLHKDKNGVFSDGGGAHITHWMPLPDLPKD